MKSQLIIILLVAGLNIPVYLELYKHALKNRPIWIKVAATAAFWITAIQTQTIAAFAAILYLYFVYYRKLVHDQGVDDRDIWHMDVSNFLRVAVTTVGARIAILIVHLIYIIILVKLVKYNIKPQDIITYYTEAQSIAKIIMAFEIVLLAPVVEEYVFRFFLYDKVFAPRMPRYLAVLFSTILFTALHFNVSGVPTFFGLGLFCTYWYQKKGYWAAVTAHGASNLITLLLI